MSVARKPSSSILRFRALTIDHSLSDIHDRAYFSRLVNNPMPHPLRKPLELVYHATVNTIEPQYTVVTPTFNHAPTVADYIGATTAAASLPFDLIIVDDGSEDGTAERAKAIFESMRCPHVARVTIVHNPVPVFETACDNIGFTLAKTEVIVEIQCDIQVRERGYDALLLHALATPAKPSAVSGRCGHSFFDLRGTFVRALFGRGAHTCVGLCGKLIETPEVINAIKGRIYQCETAPRGPWAVLKSDLERVGYLDERFFFLGRDDHDYHRRLFEADGRRPVYVPLSLYAPLHLGADRRVRTGINREVYEMLRADKNGSPAFRRFLGKQTAPSLPRQIA
jgi:Glycosyl transferase family 2